MELYFININKQFILTSLSCFVKISNYCRTVVGFDGRTIIVVLFSKAALTSFADVKIVAPMVTTIHCGK